MDDISKANDLNVSVGAHLCLDEFRSISHSKIGSRKVLSIMMGFFRYTRSGFNEGVREALKRELSMQIELLKVDHYEFHI